MKVSFHASQRLGFEEIDLSFESQDETVVLLLQMALRRLDTGPNHPSDQRRVRPKHKPQDEPPQDEPPISLDPVRDRLSLLQGNIEDIRRSWGDPALNAYRDLWMAVSSDGRAEFSRKRDLGSDRAIADLVKSGYVEMSASWESGRRTTVFQITSWNLLKGETWPDDDPAERKPFALADPPTERRADVQVLGARLDRTIEIIKEKVMLPNYERGPSLSDIGKQLGVSSSRAGTHVQALIESGRVVLLEAASGGKPPKYDVMVP